MREPKTLIALNAIERSHFLNEETRSSLAAFLPSAVWFDPDGSTSQSWLDALDQVRPEILVSAWSTPSLPVEEISELRYVCHVTGSVRALVPRVLIERGVLVSNWGSIAAPMVAEHALLLTLGAMRNLPQWEDFLYLPGIHDKMGLGTRTLFGQKIALHGFGLIARELVALLQPFRASISCYSAGVPADFLRQHGVEPVGSLRKLCDGATVFICCEALSPINRLSLTREMLSLLAPGAVFVNVGRGALVDEIALTEVAQSRGLRVATDVFAVEPLPDDSPLRDLPGSLYSPHIGGPTMDAFPLLGTMALENIRRYISSQPVAAEVTLEIYDRAT